MRSTAYCFCFEYKLWHERGSSLISFNVFVLKCEDYFLGIILVAACQEKNAIIFLMTELNHLI